MLTTFTGLAWPHWNCQPWYWQHWLGLPVLALPLALAAMASTALEQLDFVRGIIWSTGHQTKFKH